MKSLFPLCSVLCLALLACGGPEEPWPEPGDTLEAMPAGLVSTQGSQVQGSQVQGSQVLGSPLESVSVAGASLKGVVLQNLKVFEGGLVADGSDPEPIAGWTASLDACATSGFGMQRSCGFTSHGVGTCTPGAPIVLGGGAGGYGTCTGDPMLRVCSDNTPCEWGGSNYLTSGDDTGSSLCPSVSFVCPSSGVYNVLAGGYSSTSTWSMTVEASQGQLPTMKLREGTMLEDALLTGKTASGDSVNLRINRVELAPWEPSGKTWLYDVSYQLPGDSTWSFLCPDTGNLAVAVAGVFLPDGTYDYGDLTRFTFACDSGVAAKCYRWGYRPWRDSKNPMEPDQMKKAYWTCTRMARADYCGDGGSFTLDGTLINLWDDNLKIQTKDSVASMEFEAGWNTQGAVCLSHERWAQLGFNPSLCQNGKKLYAPQYFTDGSSNICPSGRTYELYNGHRYYRDRSSRLQPCASLCEHEEDGDLFFDESVNLFNESRLN